MTKCDGFECQLMHVTINKHSKSFGSVFFAHQGCNGLFLVLARDHLPCSRQSDRFAALVRQRIFESVDALPNIMLQSSRFGRGRYGIKPELRYPNDLRLVKSPSIVDYRLQFTGNLA